MKMKSHMERMESDSAGARCGLQPPSEARANTNQIEEIRAAVGAAGPGGSPFHAIEVVQTVQNLAHTVPLVANKPAVARAYLDLSLPVRVKVSANLLGSWRANSQSPFTVFRTVPSTGFVTLEANSNPPSRRAATRDWQEPELHPAE